MSPLSQGCAARFQSINGVLKDIPTAVNDLIAKYDDSPPIVVSFKLTKACRATQVLRALSYRCMNERRAGYEVFKRQNHLSLDDEEFLEADFLLPNLNIYLLHEWLHVTWWKVPGRFNIDVQFVFHEHFDPSARLTLKLGGQVVDWKWNLDGCQKFWGSPIELRLLQFGTNRIPTYNYLFDNTDFDGTVFKDCSFSQIEFDCSYLLNSQFLNCRFGHCRLIKESFTSVLLKNCSFESCSFDNYKFGSSVIEGTKFIECKFRTIIRCPDSDVVKSDSETVEFSSVTFQNTYFSWDQIPVTRTVVPQILTEACRSNFKVRQDKRSEKGDQFQSIRYEADGFVETAKIGCPMHVGMEACTIL